MKLVKNKPKAKGNDSLDDYDYGEEDSEEWETEDEEVLEENVPPFRLAMETQEIMPDFVIPRNKNTAC